MVLRELSISTFESRSLESSASNISYDYRRLYSDAHANNTIEKPAKYLTIIVSSHAHFNTFQLCIYTSDDSLNPLAILALDTKLLDIYILSDIANFGIIATFFKDLEIRRILGSFLGVEVKYSPWTIDSPVQWLAMIRNITLLIIWIYVLSISLKTLSSQLDENTYIASTEVKVYGKSENHDIHKGS